jgi:hypothetical protein
LIEHIPKEVALWMDKAYPRNIAKNGNTVMIPLRCMANTFRNKNGKDDQMIVVAAALWNLHLLCKS